VQKFEQVTRNLLSNAIKFSTQKGRIWFQADRSSDCYQFSVIDEGIGIPPEELETVFDQFSQSSLTRSGAGGTGLGLPICREIVAGSQRNSRGPYAPSRVLIFLLTVLSPTVYIWMVVRRSIRELSIDR